MGEGREMTAFLQNFHEKIGDNKQTKEIQITRIDLQA